MKLTNKMLKKFEKEFNSNKSNQVIKNAIANIGILESSFNNDVYRKHNFVFSDEISLGKITNQKKSGRCWMFASFNVDRLKVMKNLNLESFEFSENYLFFWDKMEKANNFLENIIENRKEDTNSRLMELLINMSVDDGAYWENFAGLVRKYGAVPKSCMPETFHSSNSDVFVNVMEARLKKYAKDIINSKSNKIEDLRKIKEEALSKIYDICVKALGVPPTKFTFQYVDKDKKYKKIESTPLEFYEKYVGFEALDKVNLINDPRGKYKSGDYLELKYFKSVRELDGTRLLVVPFSELKKATIKSIKDNVPVWFAADVSHFFERKKGIMDTSLYQYDSILNELGDFSKGDRLEYYVSRANHAMVFTGVDLDENNNPIKWRVENSWGEENGEKGIYSMSDDWFDEYNFMVIVDKKYVNKKYLKSLEKEPKGIEIWEPLAKACKMY